MAIIEVVRPKAELLTPPEWIREYARLTEVFGRTCYKSEARITPDSAPKFIGMLRRRGHESVFEHCVATMRFTCSRACSHQMVRHRIAAYSQESMRCCNYGKAAALKVVAPLPVEDEVEEGWRFLRRGDLMRVCFSDVGGWPAIAEQDHPYVRWAEACCRSYETYTKFVQDGWKPEDARFVLPIGTKTELVATYNLRQWRHVFEERALNSHAQWEIRRVMLSALSQLFELAPSFFRDQMELAHERGTDT